MESEPFVFFYVYMNEPKEGLLETEGRGSTYPTNDPYNGWTVKRRW